MAPKTYEVNIPQEFRSIKSKPTVAVIDLPDSNGNKDRTMSFDDALKEIGEGQTVYVSFAVNKHFRLFLEAKISYQI